MQRISLVILGIFVTAAGAESQAPRGVEAGLAIVALGTLLLPRRLRRRRRVPRARIVQSLIKT